MSFYRSSTIMTKLKHKPILDWHFEGGPPEPDSTIFSNPDSALTEFGPDFLWWNHFKVMHGFLAILNWFVLKFGVFNICIVKMGVLNAFKVSMLANLLLDY